MADVEGLSGLIIKNLIDKHIPDVLEWWIASVLLLLALKLMKGLCFAREF